ncbi:UPF0223 family protein [Staphylococcus simiae]|uniref:UPF0223 protein SS7213T_12817 n=1 Tax=Staphylococcus simiae CCM 7213 = CCUG 51256 TaxID=911238 RepID=G5JM40_9STAP|nr:UPF0223 family protein [Staphylococcus simiae]EHJ06736.1 hypothetical protein SS7213T_12817 [Staphylococcus simiae CCM 7213 = CCUG 51256]PNZ13660.1 hypothetical protein CD113_04300 [Staphylococcus simiae]SNV68202.1 Putative cytosolic protein [Staphylococcus simiae]
MEYQYPIDLDWSNDEMMTVINFFNKVEQYYEAQVKGHEFMDAYKQFKKIVPGKAQEKQIFNEFEQASGYSSYHAVQDVKNHPEQMMFKKKA